MALPIYKPVDTNYYGNDEVSVMKDIDQMPVLNFETKANRKAVFRRTIDYYASMTEYLQQMNWRTVNSRRQLIQPDVMYQHLLTPPMDYKDNPMNCVCTKHIRTSTNKNKCPIYVVCWTPDGRRLITGASSGEFTLWNGLTFNFETILQAHDTHIRTMKWSHNEEWLLSADDSGMVKYWQTNMNDVHVFQAHKDSVRGVDLSPFDDKFVTCSTDNTVRIFDFQTSQEERVLRGHGGEVRCVNWHPTHSLLISGSKDNQQPIKLWDPKAGTVISTLYAHKSTVTDLAINKINSHWFLSASKDHQIKLFDLRNLKSELQLFRGHKKDVIRVAWHPLHESLFASGSGDGALMFWMASLSNPSEVEVGCVEDAHDNIIWSIDWHPLGHILSSGSNDFATKFWTRNRPGDLVKVISGSSQQPVGDGGVATQTAIGPDINSIEAEINKYQPTTASTTHYTDMKREHLPGIEDGAGFNDDDRISNNGSPLGADQLSNNMSAGGVLTTGGASGAVRTIPRQFSALWSTPGTKSLATQAMVPPVVIEGGAVAVGGIDEGGLLPRPDQSYLLVRPPPFIRGGAAGFRPPPPGVMPPHPRFMGPPPGEDGLVGEILDDGIVGREDDEDLEEMDGNDAHMELHNIEDGDYYPPPVPSSGLLHHRQQQQHHHRNHRQHHHNPQHRPPQQYQQSYHHPHEMPGKRGRYRPMRMFPPRGHPLPRPGFPRGSNNPFEPQIQGGSSRPYIPLNNSEGEPRPGGGGRGQNRRHRHRPAYRR